MSDNEGGALELDLWLAITARPTSGLDRRGPPRDVLDARVSGRAVGTGRRASSATRFPRDGARGDGQIPVGDDHLRKGSSAVHVESEGLGQDP